MRNMIKRLLRNSTICLAAALVASAQFSYANGDDICKGPDLFLYTTTNAIPDFMRMPTIETNDKNIRAKMQKKFAEAYFNPFETAKAISFLEELEIDTVNADSLYKQIKKPKILYSKLSLYEKSQYPVSELAKLKREEEEYRFRVKKAMQIARNTRIFDPFSQNRHITEIIKFATIFAQNKEQKKDIFEIVRANKLQNIIASRIGRNDYITEAFKLALKQAGINYYYESSDIASKNLVIKDTLTDPKNKEDISGKVFFLVFAGMNPSKFLTEEEKLRLEQIARQYNVLCSKNKKNDEKFLIERENILKKTPLRMAIDIFAVAYVFPEKFERMYAVYNVIWPRKRKFLESLMLWSYKKTKQFVHVPTEVLYPFLEEKPSVIEPFLNDIWRKLRYELLRKDNFKDVYVLSKKILQKETGDVKIRTKIKKLFEKSAIQTQKYFQKKGNLKETYKIFEEMQRIIKK